MNNLANVTTSQGKYAQAESLLQPDPGDPAPRVGGRASRHAGFHEQSGQPALRTSRASTRRLRRFTARPGDQAPRAGSGASRYADVHEQSGGRLPRQGKYAQAEALHSQVLRIQRRVLGPEHPDTLKFHEQSGQRLQRAGQVRAGRDALQPDTCRDPAPRVRSRASRHAGVHESIWPALYSVAGQVRAGRGAVRQTVGSSAACWVPSILSL
jgi:hypothetical protein